MVTHQVKYKHNSVPTNQAAAAEVDLEKITAHKDKKVPQLGENLRQ